MKQLVKLKDEELRRLDCISLVMFGEDAVTTLMS